MEQGKLKEIKTIINSVIISSPRGLTVDQLNRDYKQLEGQYIPFRNLGFRSLEQFLSTLTDTVVVNGSMVYAIPSEKNAHINRFVSQQRNSSKSKGLLPIPRPVRIRSSYSPAVEIKQHPVIPDSRQYVLPTLYPNLNSNPNVYAKSLQYQNQPKINQPTFNYYGNAGPNLYVFQNQINNMNNYVPTPTQVLINQSQQQALYYNNSLKYSNPIVQNTVSKTNTAFNNVYKPRQRKPLEIVNPNHPFTAKEIVEHVKQNTPNVEERECLIPAETDGTSMTMKNKSLSFMDEYILPTSEAISQRSEPSLLKEIPISLEMPTQNVEKNQNSATSLTTGEVPHCSLNTPEILDIHEAEPKRKDMATLTDYFNETSISSGSDSNSKLRLKKLRDLENDFIKADAVPDLSNDDVLNLLDFPPNTVKCGQRIPSFEIPEDLDKQCFGIYVTEIHNPYKFWFHMYQENDLSKNQHDLDSLMQDIEEYYTKLSQKELLMKKSSTKPGQICVALYMNMWHRAEILDVPAAGKVKVFFIDYGTVAYIKLTEIKYLLTDFAHLPYQAYRGCLADIKPIKNKWSRDASYAFMDMVTERFLYGKVTEIDNEEKVIYMLITDTNRDEDYQINDALIKRGHACLSHPNLNYEMRLARKKHPQEVYPTFDMLETGIFPTFSELDALLRKGIDYETNTTLNEFNEVNLVNAKSAAINEKNHQEENENICQTSFQTNPFLDMNETNSFATRTFPYSYEQLNSYEDQNLDKYYLPNNSYCNYQNYNECNMYYPATNISEEELKTMLRLRKTIPPPPGFSGYNPNVSNRRFCYDYL